jgi:hypothetical protein
LEGIDAAQTNDLGGVMDEILAAQMEILAENEVYHSGEDTMGEDSDGEESLSGKGTHNPAVPEFKASARAVNLVQEGDKMRLGYVVAVRGNEKGGPPFYTAYLEGLGENRLRYSDSIMCVLKRNTLPPYVRPSPIPLFFQGISRQIRQKRGEIISQADV